jgi:hypothetical protein
MKLSKDKKEKIRKLIDDTIGDIEIDDFQIGPSGYREYDITYFTTTLDGKELYKEIIKIIEGE